MYLRQCCFVLLFLSSNWNFATAQEQSVTITLEELYEDTSDFPGGCSVSLNLTNNSEEHIDLIKGNLSIGDKDSDILYFEFENVPAHGSGNYSTSTAHSCTYTLWQFETIESQQRRPALDRCAMEGEREGDCIRSISMNVSHRVTPEMAKRIDVKKIADLAAARREFCRTEVDETAREFIACVMSCPASERNVDGGNNCASKCMTGRYAFRFFSDLQKMVDWCHD